MYNSFYRPMYDKFTYYIKKRIYTLSYYREYVFKIDFSDTNIVIDYITHNI